MQEAEECAIKRGKCFEESTKAFAEDRKDEAKTLSDEGKQHGLQMEEANKRAAAEIINPQSLSTSDKIDLHGLLVQEAIDATKDFVKSCIGKKETVQVITGQGIHSDLAKGAVIKPAIIDLCKQENWQLDAESENAGSFILHVPSA
jgi:DNA-nicking Smr family endonuclease